MSAYAPVPADPKPNVVRFPAPPPTTNALSAAQRIRLVRSAKKLARILGATPHFVDEAEEEPLNISGRDSYAPAKGLGSLSPSASPSPYPYPTLRSPSRASIDSSLSLSSASTTTTTSSSTLLSRSNSLPTSRRTRKPPLFTHDTWPGAGAGRKPPTLRLALSSPPALEAIPASPLTPLQSASPSTSANSASASSCPSFPPEAEASHPVATAPTFTIPHPHLDGPAARRRKMERLRKTLGEGVPVRLVFPRSRSSSASASGSVSEDGYGDGYEDRDAASASSESSESDAPATPDTDADVDTDTDAQFPVSVSLSICTEKQEKSLPAAPSAQTPTSPSPPPSPSRSPTQRLGLRTPSKTTRAIADARDSIMMVALDTPDAPSPHRRGAPTKTEGPLLREAARRDEEERAEKPRAVRRKPVPVPGWYPYPYVDQELYAQDSSSDLEETVRASNTYPHTQVRGRHRRSPSSSSWSSESESSSWSSRSTAGLGVIPESPLELEPGFVSEHARKRGGEDAVEVEETEDEDEEEGFEVLRDDEVLEAALSAGPGAGAGCQCGWGWGCVGVGVGVGAGEDGGGDGDLDLDVEVRCGGHGRWKTGSRGRGRRRMARRSGRVET